MDETIFQTHWVKVKQTPKGFQFLERKGKDSVAIFLVRKDPNPPDPRYYAPGFQVLIRYQPLPLDNDDLDQTLWPCPITGSKEVGEDSLACALREVEEETGYVLTDLRDLGLYIVGTQTNEIVRMFWFDIGSLTPEKVKGDGSFHESISQNKWENIHDLKDCSYSACQIGYYRLKEKLGI